MGKWEPGVTIPTLVCSTLSCVASALVLVLWLISKDPAKRQSFRYALVINLTLAEFLNSLDNTISGLWVLVHQREMQAGPACRLNGWLDAFSVQGADFSILAIAIVTIMTVNFNPWIVNATPLKRYLICMSVWIIPIINATTALALGKIGPASGNSCWLSKDPKYLRYVLGHGWRLSIFAITIVIYIFVFTSVKKRLKKRDESLGKSQKHYSVDPKNAGNSMVEFSMRHAHDKLIKGKQSLDTTRKQSQDYGVQQDDKQPITRPALVRSAFSYDGDDDNVVKRLALRPKLRILQPSSKLDQETSHWFLLSAFPLTYIIVWIPGIANRLAELTGHEYQWLNALQATTMLTGFVNALVYGLREHRGLWKRMHQRYQNQV